MSLEAKKQEANNKWLSLRIKPTKQCIRNIFYWLKCIKEGLANLLKDFKEPTSYCNIFRGVEAAWKLWFMVLETKRHRKRYERRIYWFPNIKAKYNPRI